MYGTYRDSTWSNKFSSTPNKWNWMGEVFFASARKRKSISIDDRCVLLTVKDILGNLFDSEILHFLFPNFSFTD